MGGICDTTDTKFSTFVNPVITSKCVSCHNSVTPSGGYDLDGYDKVKANYPAILSSVNSGSMPKGSAPLDACTVTKIQVWVNRGANNN